MAKQRTLTGQAKFQVPGGQATPATYWSSKSNRQFVVIAAGGHPAFRSGSADALIAYALPAGN